MEKSVIMVITLVAIVVAMIGTRVLPALQDANAESERQKRCENNVSQHEAAGGSHGKKASQLKSKLCD